MGCRESKSKHIATGNTITTSSSSRKSTNHGQGGTNKNNAQTLQNSTSGRSSTLQQQRSSKGINAADSKANNIVSNETVRTGDRKGKNVNVSMNDDDMKMDSGSGASEYCTPTEAAGAFGNTKSENAEEKKETFAEGTDKENLAGNVDASLKKYVREAQVDEKIREAEAAVANPGNHLREAEVEEKIKEAEAAVEFLEKLVKETDKTKEIRGTEKAAAGNMQNPVKEETEAEANDATLHNPVEASEKSERSQGTEAKDIDDTLQNAGSDSDKNDETLSRAGEAVENGVKEIHEVTEETEELPVKEAETSHRTDQEALVSDKAEVLGKEVEADYRTPKDPLKEAKSADGENPASRLENAANH